MASSAPTISQLSSFSSINRTLNLRRQSVRFPCLPFSRSKFFVVTRLEGSEGLDSSGSEIKTKLNHTADESIPYEGEAAPAKHSNNVEQEKGIADPAKAYGSAKIHDFCFGIPYGGLVLSGGFLGFLFSRNPTTLSTGVLYGGALLALSFLSLKIWRQGKSSIPFVLGQAVLSAALFWKNFQAYSLTKKIIPTGLYCVISAVMLCFYSYVMISGGNPPPKKLQSSTAGS